MKKTAFILMSVAAVSMFFAGCKKDSKVTTFGVEVEKAVGDSKIYIDEDHNPVFFQSGEQINVNGTEYDVEYNNPRYEVAVNDEGEGATYYAFYPTTLNSNGFTGTSNQPVHLSRWQKYVYTTDGKQNIQLPAAAVISDNSKKFKFYNLCSLLEVQWTNNSTYDYDIIGIEVTVPGAALYGDGVANNIGTATSSITLSEELNNRVNLDIAVGDRETVEANATSRKYYVFLPPFENKNVTVRIQTMRTTQNTLDDQKLRTITVSTTNAVTLPRNYIVPMHISGTPTENTSLTGYFSVRGDRQGNDTYKVVFSRGNLQHIGNPVHSDGTWKFADRQYDFFGGKNMSGDGYSQTQTTDLFCWSETESVENDKYGLYVYDPYYAHWAGSASTTFVDWGNKSISGDAANTWFTLTADEWFYLFHYRVNSTGDQLRGRVIITGIQGHQASQYTNQTTTPRAQIEGFALLPDDWTSADVPSGLSFSPSAVNTYSVADWARMEAAGAMFLPAAGYGSSYHDEDEDAEDGGDVYGTYRYGRYWSATRHQPTPLSTYGESYYVGFDYDMNHWYLMAGGMYYAGDHISGQAYANYDNNWWHGYSVRLVQPAPGYTDPDGRSIVNASK